MTSYLLGVKRCSVITQVHSTQTEESSTTIPDIFLQFLSSLSLSEDKISDSDVLYFMLIFEIFNKISQNNDKLHF